MCWEYPNHIGKPLKTTDDGANIKRRQDRTCIWTHVGGLPTKTEKQHSLGENGEWLSALLRLEQTKDVFSHYSCSNHNEVQASAIQQEKK